MMLANPEPGKMTPAKTLIKTNRIMMEVVIIILDFSDLGLS